MTDLYITTSIPYVNGVPHLGHALEFVHVDVLARHRVHRGGRTRVQSGTDDHAIKNVSAAELAGVPVADFVAANGDRFAELTAALGVHTDGFLRTGSDSRHGPGVAALWRACQAGGDLYTKDYTGCYCPGCEQFFTPDELDEGSCIEHRAPVVKVSETNWFFRLSRYREQITALITSGELDITPVERRNEVLGFLAGEVGDLSVSRPAARTRCWGIPVPGDPGQVVYVWFDALSNYLTGLGYSDSHDRDALADGGNAGGSDSSDFRRWWAGQSERVHVIGKGIVRFHAVYWIAFLLSAGLPLPTRILVHDYLTVDGTKIAKSGARAADPAALVAAYGVDAVRWWLLRAPAPVATTDFTIERLVAAYNRDLANTLGNLASRALALSRRSTAWRTTPGARASAGVGEDLLAQAAALPAAVDHAVARYDLRSACAAIVALAEAGNRFIEAEAPWQLARKAEAGDARAARRFEAVIDAVLTACRAAADELRPFLPDGAARLVAQLAAVEAKPAPVFPRIPAGQTTT